MKEIFNYCNQVRRYGPSKGQCLIQFEPGDDPDAIIAERTKEKAWYEQKYSAPKRLKEHSYEVNKYDKERGSYKEKVTVTGDLVLFDTDREYLD